jgi:hypothetical protein
MVARLDTARVRRLASAARSTGGAMRTFGRGSTAILGLGAALTLAGCAHAVAPPTAADVQRSEEMRILQPLASPTGRPGRLVVEFAPTVEVRNVACAPATGGRFDCAFESRRKEALGRAFGGWTPRRETLERVHGRWWFGA